MKRLSFFIVAVLLAFTSTLAASGDGRTITKTVNNHEVSIPSASEKSVAPLIREDRIWEYVDNDDLGKRRLIRMKFDGMVEIDGKFYHILNSIYAKGGALLNTQPEHDGVFEAKAPIAYMREENGKVWMRQIVDYDQALVLAGGFFSRSNHHSGAVGIVGSLEQDYLLYDFSADEGDSVNTLCLFDSPENECKRGHLMGICIWYDGYDRVNPDSDGKEYCLYDFCCREGVDSREHRAALKDWEYRVSEVSDLEIDNQDKMTDSPAYHGTLKLQKTCWFDAVEGVGCLRGGTLCFPGTHYWWTDCWGEDIYLNRVYDADMNVVFGNPLPECPVIETNITISGIESVNVPVNTLYNGNEIIVNGTGTINLMLYAADGNLISSVRGENEATVSTAGLPAGVYLAVIKSGNSSETKKILVK